MWYIVLTCLMTAFSNVVNSGVETEILRYRDTEIESDCIDQIKLMLMLI